MLAEGGFDGNGLVGCRSIWHERMVDLFLDTALLAKGSNHAAVTDLGALLQPLSQAAAACRPAAPTPAVLQRVRCIALDSTHPKTALLGAGV